MPYEDWKEQCEQNGISKWLFNRRIFDYVYPWTEEKAATTPKKSRSDRNRKYPKKYIEIAESNGITKNQYYERLKRKGSQFYKNPELCSTIPIKKVKENA